MSFALDRSLRRIKPQRERSSLKGHSVGSAYLDDPHPVSGRELLLDSTVYIDVLQGRSPPEVDELLSVRIVNHSAIVLSELTHLFGRLEPKHPGTRGVLARLRLQIERIPPHRLTVPSIQSYGEAGMLAGLLTRLVGENRNVLNDALLYLHALELGCVVLTRNVNDFDLLQQLMPSGDVLFYRCS